MKSKVIIFFFFVLLFFVPITLANEPTPISKDECKDMGWKMFTQPVFKNQGDCVSFVEHNTCTITEGGWTLQGQTFIISFMDPIGFSHQYTVVSQNSLGEFTGTGFLTAFPSLTETITGNIFENTISLTATRDSDISFKLFLTGTIAPDGSMTGIVEPESSETYGSWAAPVETAKSVTLTTCEPKSKKNKHFHKKDK